MEDELLDKVIDFIKRNYIGIGISLLSIIGSVVYVSNTHCPKCEICEFESESTYDTKFFKVDVKGAVKSPHVYTLEEGATVEDAINMAGGLNSDGVTKNINLSRRIKDEMVIYVFNKKEIEERETKNEIVCEVPKCECEEIVIEEKTTNTNNKPIGKISINTATMEELMTLNGIGESKAQEIINYRNTNGNFNSIEEIKNVSGIGDAAYEKIKDYITT